MFCLFICQAKPFQSSSSTIIALDLDKFVFVVLQDNITKKSAMSLCIYF
jgi:hypothetical protein